MRNWVGLALASLLMIASGCVSAEKSVGGGSIPDISIKWENAFSEPPDICVFGPYSEDTDGDDYTARIVGVINQLPDSVKIVEFFGTNYHNYNLVKRLDGTPGYDWVYPEGVRIAREAAQARGKKCIFYFAPGHYSASAGGPRTMFAEIARIYREGWDGIFFDGAPGGGYLSSGDPATIKYIKRLRARLDHDMVIVLHLDGRVTPNVAESVADVVYVGEFGWGSVPWSTQPPHIWGKGDWRLMDRLDHPQLHTYYRKLLRLGTWPCYKMASGHAQGTACHPDTGECYPNDWPTVQEWSNLTACYGGVRRWCQTRVDPIIIAAQEVRDRYASNDVAGP